MLKLLGQNLPSSCHLGSADADQAGLSCAPVAPQTVVVTYPTASVSVLEHTSGMGMRLWLSSSFLLLLPAWEPLVTAPIISF